MEPCELDLEKKVFPKKFKYKILEMRKIDSQNFECELRIALNDHDDVKEWFKHFKRNTNTEWLLRQSTTCKESVLNQLYVCQNSLFGKKRKYDDDEGSKLDFNCNAAISVKIIKGGKRTYYQDEYVKKGYKGIMRICFIHSHLIDKTEILNMARQTEETKKAFIGYFTEGMSPSEAIRNHEEILLLEGHEDLGNSRKNPTEQWVYSLYEEWTKQIQNRLQLESQLARASVFWRLQNQSTQRSDNRKSKNIVKLCKLAEDMNSMQIPSDLNISDNEDDDDSDSENQYDSYDEDSSPQVSTSYVSVSTTSHQATASSAPLKLNVPSNINITRGCTLQVIKNNNGGSNKPSANVLPFYMRVGKGISPGQDNSVQIITTSHENNKKSVFKFLTVSANSRKYVQLGKTLRIVNTPEANLGSGKDVDVNFKEHQKVSESLPKRENVTKANDAHFIKNHNEDSLETSKNMESVFKKTEKSVVNEEASSSLEKYHEVQKDTETVMQHILTKFKNSDDKDIFPYKNLQTFPRNKVACHKSDLHNESMKPVLKKCVQNFENKPLSENFYDTGIALKNGQNRTTENDRNCPKQVFRDKNDSINRPAPVKKVITITRYSVLSRFRNPSSDDKRDKNYLKNIDQHKDKKNIHCADSKILSQDCEKQFESLEKLNNTNQITPSSENDTFDNCQISTAVPKKYCDIAQLCSSSSPESLPQVFQSSNVQSITNPISNVVQGLDLSKPTLFDNIDTISKPSKHDTEVPFSSALCHEDLSKVHNESAFQNSNYLERLPIQGCPFPLPEDLYHCVTANKDSSYIGSHCSEDYQIFPYPLSKDLYDCNKSSNAQLHEKQNEADPRGSLILSQAFCDNSDQQNATEGSGNHFITSDLSYPLHGPDLNTSCNDMNSLQLPSELDMNNEDGLQKIFPDMSKLEDRLNNFTFDFSTIPNHQQMDLCGSYASVGNQLSFINTYTNSLPELQANPHSLFENYEDNILPLPENLKGNIEDLDILKNILNIKCNKLENSELEEFFQQPENCNHKEILEKWDSEMCRLRSLLEQNAHDGELMTEANQFLERIKERIVTPLELAIFFSSACNLEEKKY